MDRKQSIINTYLRLGCRKGFLSVSLSDIAKEEGFSKASLFSHFSSFDHLRSQTDSFCLNALQNKEIKVDFNAEDMQGLFVNLINSFIDSFMQEPLLSFCKMVDQLKLVSERYAGYSKIIDNMITARTTIALDFCVQRGWADIDDTDSLALVLTPFVRNILISDDKSDLYLDEAVKTVASLIRK